jgi:hypothetical protein
VRGAAGCFTALGLSLALGCGSGDRIAPPNYSPSEAARLAMAEYDTNKDGRIDAKELARCPALKSALANIDKNKDGAIDAQELQERLEAYQASGVAVSTVACRVVRGEDGVKGALVTLVPEKFHGDSLKPASGVSDIHGDVELTVAGSTVPGVAFGFYRIEVSIKNGDRETLPARFNSQTTLGVEVHPFGRAGGIEINLK